MTTLKNKNSNTRYTCNISEYFCIIKLYFVKALKKETEKQGCQKNKLNNVKSYYCPSYWQFLYIR